MLILVSVVGIFAGFGRRTLFERACAIRTKAEVSANEDILLR